ncbi:hypothetical protein EDB87DRAFT_1821312 [Lactarius vividus]|nr:hypothetical protein EDB87DRAFT_1821312 [Lactarius vividus]
MLCEYHALTSDWSPVWTPLRSHHRDPNGILEIASLSPVFDTFWLSVHQIAVGDVANETPILSPTSAVGNRLGNDEQQTDSGILPKYTPQHGHTEISSVAFLCEWQELGSPRFGWIIERFLVAFKSLAPTPHETARYPSCTPKIAAQLVATSNSSGRRIITDTPRKVEEVQGLIYFGTIPHKVRKPRNGATVFLHPFHGPLRINKAINYRLLDATPGEREHLEFQGSGRLPNLSWVSCHFGTLASPRKDSEVVFGRGGCNIAVIAHQITSESSVYHQSQSIRRILTKGQVTFTSFTRDKFNFFMHYFRGDRLLDTVQLAALRRL